MTSLIKKQITNIAADMANTIKQANKYAPKVLMLLICS